MLVSALCRLYTNICNRVITFLCSGLFRWHRKISFFKGWKKCAQAVGHAAFWGVAFSFHSQFFPVVTGLCIPHLPANHNVFRIRKTLLLMPPYWHFPSVEQQTATRSLTVGSVQREHLEHSWQGAPGERGFWQKWSYPLMDTRQR